MEKFQIQKSPRQICFCGDPNCPGEKMFGSGGATTATEARERAGSLWGNDLLSLLQGQMKTPSSHAEYDSARKKVAKYLLDVQYDTAWDDIVGNDDARAALIEAIEEPRRHPDLYKFYGMKPPKGVLLYGPPGCGKTMFAKAAAAAVGRLYGTAAEVLLISGPSIQSTYVGGTEETIRNIFAYARLYSARHGHPLTVFIDEAEVFLPDRTGRTRQVFSYEESNVAQFLAEMDGLESMGAFVILATNRPEAIDEALLRDGRCDRKIRVNRPTREATESILQKVLSKVPSVVPVDDLVVAGVESFFNPHYVICDGHLVAQRNGQADRHVAINFCLEHVVSGAMVTSVATRATSRAFRRDRDAGVQRGLTVPDVVDAVKEIFEENRKLSHSFAIQEFAENLPVREMLEPKGRVQ
ncbi:AAA family ATPase [Mesorhizobium sp. ANAO-SY3R2]|uniref:AAA family ATPase n=1 Tax=Mesorhizobium sp. ANAO-SY3R2 TaxID=3166644 RepID=UPI00366D0114